MRAKSFVSILACIALSACLAVAYETPDAAYANDVADTSPLVAGEPATQAEMTESPSKPQAVSSVKLTAKISGKAKATWKVLKTRVRAKVKWSTSKVTVTWKAPIAEEADSQTYTVRYAYNKAMKGAKKKTVATKSLTLSNLKQGKKVYVQVRVNAKFGEKTLCSDWSAVKVVRVKKKTSTISYPYDAGVYWANNGVGVISSIDIADIGPGKIKISWKAETDKVAELKPLKYRIEIIELVRQSDGRLQWGSEYWLTTSKKSIVFKSSKFSGLYVEVIVYPMTNKKFNDTEVHIAGNYKRWVIP